MSLEMDYNICETRLMGKKTVFVWKIYDYSESLMRSKGGVKSDTFTFHKMLIHLEASLPYSAGRTLDIALVADDIFTRDSVFTIYLKDKNNHKRCKRTYIMHCGDIRHPEYAVSGREFSQSPCLLVEDCLTVICELALSSTTHTRPTEEPVPYSHLEDLCNDLKKLFSTKENSDVVLHVEGKDIPAHSAILSARSPYFSAMFNHDMVESRSREIIITDFGASAINYLLCYLYTGTLEDLKDIPGHLLTELYAAADKYDVKGLKDMCLRMMMSTLSESNIEDYATLALTLDVEKLTDAVIKYFARNDRLIKSDMWKRLEKTYPTLAILVLSDVMRRMNKDE